MTEVNQKQLTSLIVQIGLFSEELELMHKKIVRIERDLYNLPGAL